MSYENEKTVEVYNHFADKYIQNTLTKNEEDIIATQTKEKKLNDFLLFGFSTLPKNSSIFEIGSGAGENSAFLSKQGFNVTASDVALAFINETRNKQVKTIKFNVLTDSFQRKYDGILCWRVFVHFTLEDTIIALDKVYKALENKGRFIFNVMNIEEHNISSEWLDFSGVYHLGVERYYHYYDEIELNNLIEKIGFHIVQVKRDGGENNNKWLTYILEK